MQAPSGERLKTPLAQTSEEDPRRPLLSAPLGARGDGHPPTEIRDDRHGGVLVVRQRGASAPTPPFHQVPGMGAAA